MSWNYQREEQQFAIIPEGEYRVRIRKADKAVSKKGRNMIVLEFDVSGRNETLYHYITFLDDHPEITNRNLTQFFDSFKDIADGDLNMSNWIGKVGAVKIKHEESDYNGGTTQARIHYFIAASKQGNLAPWSEPTGANAKPAIDEDGFMKVSDAAADALPLF